MRSVFANTKERMRKPTEKLHNSAKLLDKRGFTLVELSVAIFLVAIIATMIVSFSVLVSNNLNKSKAEYSFLEQCSSLKTTITNYTSENDSFSLTTLKEQNFAESYTEIESVEYSKYNSLLKCTAVSTDGKTQTFVIYLRTAEVTSDE